MVVNNSAEETSDIGLLFTNILIYLMLSVLITTAIMVGCRALFYKLTKTEKQVQIDIDCELAIRKKQRLEQ